MATGTVPFRGDTSAVIFESILSRTPVSPVRLNPDLPAELERIINRGLEKDRNLRYQHASEIRAELQRLKRDTESSRSAIQPADDDENYPPLAVTPTERKSGSKVQFARDPKASHAKPTGKSSKAWRFAAASLLVIAAVAVGIFLYSHKSQALTEKDTILLADFVNTTGDPVFDGTLKQALAVQLDQSPYLNVLPESRIQEALHLMGGSPDERITNDVAKEICLRQGTKAMLAGSIAPLGSHYVIDLNAINVQTGDSLARAQVESESKENVLKSLDKAASSLRQNLGESIGSVQKFTTPLEQATTSSLEALKEYSLGHAEHQKLKDTNSVPHFKRAIELDPNFAMAYAGLGVASGNIMMPSDLRTNLTKAYELKDRASEREKLYISAHYHDSVTRDYLQSVEIYERWKQIYPHDTVPLDNLALRYIALGQYEKAVSNASEALRIDPKDIFAYQNLSDAYQRLNRYDESEAVMDKAMANGTSGPADEIGRFQIALMRGDAAGMQKAVHSSIGTEMEPILLLLRGLGECSRAKLAAARKSLAQSVEVALKNQQKEFAGGTRAYQAACEAEMGSIEESRRTATETLPLSQDRDVRTGVGNAFALTGDFARSQKIFDRLAHEFPHDLVLNQGWIPIAKALQAIHESRPEEAISLLEPTVPYEMGGPPDGVDLWPAYFRGEAYLHDGQGAKAAAEYQKLIDHRGIDPVNLMFPMAKLGLARAYVLQKDHAKARTAYQDLFAYWKDADPDVPLLKQVKAEYAKLQ
jgi:tetratricopeptide (TPR) repeat protein